MHSNKKATVEAATYRFECSSNRTCVENILDIRITLRYLGVPILSLICMFGYNKSVVDSSMNPNRKIHKRHIVLSFHRVRGSIADVIVTYQFIEVKYVPKDSLNKH